MSPTKTRIATAAAIAALAAGATAAMAQGPATPQPGTVLDLTAKPTGGAGLDLGRKGPSVGDQFFEHGTLTDSAGRGAGRFQLVTQLVAGNARHGTEQNEFTLSLGSGQLEVVGGHPTASRFTMPVVGGTGDYEGARGTFSVAPAAHGAEHLTVKLDAR